jgi:hypothetical protein
MYEYLCDFHSVPYYSGPEGRIPLDQRLDELDKDGWEVMSVSPSGRFQCEYLIFCRRAKVLA